MLFLPVFDRYALPSQTTFLILSDSYAAESEDTFYFSSNFN